MWLLYVYKCCAFKKQLNHSNRLINHPKYSNRISENSQQDGNAICWLWIIFVYRICFFFFLYLTKSCNQKICCIRKTIATTTTIITTTTRKISVDKRDIHPKDTFLHSTMNVTQLVYTFYFTIKPFRFRCLFLFYFHM